MRYNKNVIGFFLGGIGLVASSLVLSHPGSGSGQDKPGYQASSDAIEPDAIEEVSGKAKKRKRQADHSVDAHQYGMPTEIVSSKKNRGFRKMVIRIMRKAKRAVSELAGQLSCLNVQSTEECVELEIDNQLLTQFSQLWLHPPTEELRPYDAIDHTFYLKAMNPSLWDRLGLGSLTAVTLPESMTQTSAEYYLGQAAVREVLARQDEQHPALPYVEVFLQDMAGNSFSLIELPQNWLRSPEVVRHISSLNLHNTVAEFDRAAAGVELVRQLFSLLSDIHQTRDSQLANLLNQCGARNLALGMFRDGRGLSAADLAIEEGASGSQIKLIHASGQVAFNEQHCAIVVRNHSGGDRKEGGATRKRLEEILMASKRDQKPFHLDQVKTESGNLLKLAIKNRLDYSSLYLIMYPSYGEGVTPDTDDFIETLRQELAETSHDLVPGHITRFLPEGSLTSWEQWRDDESGRTLLDIVLATENSLYYFRRIHPLGFPAQLDDLPAILRDTRRRDELEYILNDYGRMLGSEALKNWRDSDGRTLYEHALFHNAPVKALEIIDMHTGQAVDSGSQILSGKPASKISWHRSYIRNLLQQQTGRSGVSSSYTTALNQLLRDKGLQQGSTPKDGLCFYHAVASLFNVSEDALKAQMTNVIETALAGFQMHQNLHQHHVISHGMGGQQGMQSALQGLQNSQWGELSWFPAVAQALYHLSPDFAGFQVITPGYDALCTPVITLFQFDGTPVEVSGVDTDIPVIIHDGVNHWSFAEYIPTTIVNGQLENNSTSQGTSDSDSIIIPAQMFLNEQPSAEW